MTQLMKKIMIRYDNPPRSELTLARWDCCASPARQLELFRARNGSPPGPRGRGAHTAPPVEAGARLEDDDDDQGAAAGSPHAVQKRIQRPQDAAGVVGR